MAERSALMEGTVVASHGRHCMVETPDGARRICHPRGKKNQAVVGDHVLWQAPPPGQGEEGTIEKVKERRNLFYRQDEIRTKSFAANLDQVLILIAAEPVFSESQLSRALIAAEAEASSPSLPSTRAIWSNPLPAHGSACCPTGTWAQANTTGCCRCLWRCPAMWTAPC